MPYFGFVDRPQRTNLGARGTLESCHSVSRFQTQADARLPTHRTASGRGPAPRSTNRELGPLALVGEVDRAGSLSAGQPAGGGG